MVNVIWIILVLLSIWFIYVFGKDIIENKKTYLYLKAMELSSDDNKQKLAFFYNQKLEDNSIKITEVTRIFELYDLPLLIKAEIESFTEKAFEAFGYWGKFSEYTLELACLVAKYAKENGYVDGVWNEKGTRINQVKFFSNIANDILENEKESMEANL